MQVDGVGHHWDVQDEVSLDRLLRFRDAIGGAEFWLGEHDEAFPAMAIRISGAVADVHYFPSEGHPGFRALAVSSSSSDDQEDDLVLFRYEGADPASGEWVPRQFVIPAESTAIIARAFYRDRVLPSVVSWFEL